MKEHLEIIDRAISAVNNINKRPFIIKGGTALMKCYNLDRISEDVDFDCDNSLLNENRELLLKSVNNLCREFSDGYIRIAKDTPTTQRIMLHYGGARPLKIETSYRRKNIPEDETAIINDIRTYKINPLCQLKTAAYLGRDKIRDLYDITFIIDRYWDNLNEETIADLRRAFEYKDIAQFDYLLATQDDSLIDKAKLEDRFLSAFDKVGLLSPAPATSPPKRSR
jgi:predicted nucleotidyltransferase component of viral defense system